MGAPNLRRLTIKGFAYPGNSGPALLHFLLQPEEGSMARQLLGSVRELRLEVGWDMAGLLPSVLAPLLHLYHALEDTTFPHPLPHLLPCSGAPYALSRMGRPLLPHCSSAAPRPAHWTCAMASRSPFTVR